MYNSIYSLRAKNDRRQSIWIGGVFSVVQPFENMGGFRSWLVIAQNYTANKWRCTFF